MKGKVLWLVGFFALLPFLFINCGEGTGEEEESLSYQGFALESENGGFSKAEDLTPFEGEEPEEFADETMDVNDEDVNDAAVDVTKPDIDVYLLKIIWGQLKRNPSLKIDTVWDGSVYSNSALVKVKRLIRFEKETDYILPDKDPKKVTFKSITRPHNDGLVLLVALAKNRPLPVISTITFETKPLTRTYKIAELDGLKEVIKVDNLGNRVAFLGVKLPKNKCPHGFLDGYWKRINKIGGIFGGKFVGSEGKVEGKIAGLWGQRKNGKRVFFGIFVDKDKKLKGFLRGTYKPYSQVLPGNVDGGVFHGIYLTIDKEHKGVLKGLYFVAPEGNKGKFVGTYREKCDDKDKISCKGKDETCIPNKIDGKCDIEKPETPDEGFITCNLPE